MRKRAATAAALGGQLAHSSRAVGLTFEPLHMDKISPDGAQQAALRLHLAHVTQETPAHAWLRHYFCDVRPGVP